MVEDDKEGEEEAEKAYRATKKVSKEDSDTTPVSSALIDKFQKFRNKLKRRSLILKKLGHVDAEGVLSCKGRDTALIDIGDEHLVAEPMFNG